MKRILLICNHTLLLACTSMYMGTGLSLVFFNFVIADEMTVDNYYTHFVPQVDAATAFFTYMTVVMMVTAVIMIIAEWKTPYKWIPIIVLALVFLATALTIFFIFPYNEAMSAGITDPTVLTETLSKWMSLNRIRVSLWVVQWLCMAFYFAHKVYRSMKPSP